MSATIDQRVVEMRFDNSHFEKNVSTTMSTLDKLKSKLNLSGASKGLTDINTAARGFGNTGLAGAVDTVTTRFSALQVMGVTALANITNSAINAGKNIVKALTIDPIKTGFSEYETKLGSIQTILANTEHQGTTMNDVTRALNELNLYADKTIYNFQEMTRNIGTFTAAGIDLDTSVKSIQGIANLAAISGSTSQQASTAMYQLSQALASGTVKLMDWNSVVNAGMGGKVFQDALKRTAEVMGTNVDALIKKYGSFRETLSSGWITSDVLTKTLEQFTMAAEEGSEQWEKFKKSLIDDGYSEKQAEAILKMANTATDAATKVKTFTQLMDTLNEAAQSGWAQTWETIIGDFEEAKAFFTQLSDIFGGMIGESANRRNNFVTELFSSNWDKLISQINAAGIETETFEENIRKVVGNDKLDGFIAKYGSIQKAAEEGAISSELLKKALDGISDSGASTKIADFVKGLKEITSTLKRGDTGEQVKKLQTALDELGYDLGKPGIDGIIGPITEKAIKAFQEASNLKVTGIVDEETLAALEAAGTKTSELKGDVDDLNKSCGSLIDVITKTSGRELLLGSLLNIIKAIQRPLAAVGEAFRNTFSISPDTLYNGLEKLEKLTSKLVPKGLLDITKWDELTGVLNTFGISTSEFTLKLQDVLADHGIDVAKLSDKYGSLANAFNEGAISLEHIKETLLDFEGITEAMLISGETGEKIRRTFEGLFAIFDIIGTLAGSGLKIAFEVLSGVLAHFDMDILDLTVSIADSIIEFRDWIKSIIDVSGAVEAIMPYLEKAAKALGEFFKTIPNLDSFKNLVSALKDSGDAFKEWIETLKTSKDIPGDIISGLVSGLAGGAGAVISAAVQLAWDIIKGICSALGINSPSTKMIEIGQYVIEGLVIGLQNGVSGLWNAVKDIGAKLIEYFKNIDFGAIFGVAVGASIIWLVKKIGDALSILAVPFEGFGMMLEDLGDMFEGIGAKFKAEAWESRANAIKSFAVAVAILAGSVWVLAQIDQGKVWSAVGAITALAAVIGILSAVIGKMGASEKGGVLSKFKEFMSALNLSALGAALVGLSLAVLGIAAVVKIIGNMDPEQAKQGILGLLGIVTSISMVLAAFGLLVKGKSAQNINKLGGVLLKLSVALLLMVGVVKLASGLTNGELLKGVEFVAGFTIFIAALAAVSRLAGKHIGKIGGTLIKISVAMGLMVGVVKLIGTLSNENGELTKANEFVASFLIFVGILQFISYACGSDISKLGTGLIGIAGSMMIMVGIVKIIGGMDWSVMGKGAVGLLGLTVIIALLVGIVDSMGGDAPKIAGTLLAMSVAMAVLAGICILMGMLKLEHLAKGLGAVTVLGLVMAAMILAARGVKGCMGELVVMTVAIGVLAAAVAALSLIDLGPLWNATLAMSLLMFMFSRVAKASSNIDTSWGTMAAIAGIILVLSGIVYMLAGLPVQNVIGSAASISVLLLSLTVSLKILSTIKNMSMGAFAAMGILLLVVAGIAAVLGVLTALDCAPSIETATSISILLLAMAGVYAILGVTGGLAGTAMVGALGMMGVIAIIGGIALGIGALMSLIPESKIAEWKTGLESFMDFITILATGLGEAIGGLIGGVIDGIAGGIDTFSGSLGTLTEALGPFAEAAKKLDSDTISGVQNLAALVGIITASNFIENISSMIFGGSSMDTFASQLKSFGTAMKDYAAEVAGLDTSSINTSVSAAQGIVAVAQAIPGDGLLGLDGIDDFGRNIVVFGRAIKNYSTEVNGLNCSSIQSSVGAAKWLIEVANSIPKDGFLGLDGIDDFGRNIKTFGKGLSGYSEEVSKINSGAVTSSISAAQTLIQIASSLPDDGTLGMDGIDDFGKNIKSFGGSIKAYSENVSGIDTGSITSSLSAARTVKNFISSLAGLDTSGVNVFKDAVKQLSKVSFDGIADAFSGAAANLKAVGANMGSALAEGLRSKQSQTKAVASVMVNEAANMIKSKVAMFKSAGESLGTNFANGITSKKGDASKAGTELASQASSGAKAGKSDMTSAGYDLGNGLVAGINSMKSAAYNAGFALGQAAVQGERDGQASASPSKETIKAGKWLGEGLVIGMQRMSRVVYNAGTSMGKDAVGSISNSINRISDMISSDIDAQPTIRPVLDLSNVKTGAGAISSMLDIDPSVGVMANINGISTMMNRRGQNGANSDVVSAIDKLRKDVGNIQGTTYSIGGVSYDDGSAVGNAVLDLVRAMKVEGRI